MQKTSLAFSAVALGLCLVACSSTTAAGVGSGTPAGACDAFAQAVCNKLQECIPIGLTAQYGDVAQCTARTKQSCTNTLGATGTGATPAALNACTSAYNGAACDALLSGTVLDACKAPAGTLADGTACGDDSQCVNRNCQKTTDPACGHCAPRGGTGSGCVVSGDCTEGLICGAALKCVELGKQGAACSATQLCQANLACQNGKCDTPLAVGAQCNPAAPACNAAKGNQCGASQTCEELKLAKAGEACGVVNGQITSCAAHGKCTIMKGAQSGTCAAAAADGAACDTQKGPLCQAPAACVKGVCVFPDPNACK